MRTMFVRVETPMGPRTTVAAVWDEASAQTTADALAAAGAVVALAPSPGGRRSVAELVADRDKALVRQTRALKLVSDISERERWR